MVVIRIIIFSSRRCCCCCSIVLGFLADTVFSMQCSFIHYFFLSLSLSLLFFSFSRAKTYQKSPQLQNREKSPKFPQIPKSSIKEGSNKYFSLKFRKHQKTRILGTQHARWNYPSRNAAFLLTVGSFRLTVELFVITSDNFSLFTYNWSFFAYIS